MNKKYENSPLIVLLGVAAWILIRRAWYYLRRGVKRILIFLRIIKPVHSAPLAKGQIIYDFDTLLHEIKEARVIDPYEEFDRNTLIGWIKFKMFGKNKRVYIRPGNVAIIALNFSNAERKARNLLKLRGYESEVNINRITTSI